MKTINVILLCLVLAVILVSGCAQKGGSVPLETGGSAGTSGNGAGGVPETQIELKNGGLDVIVSPAEGKKLKGVITVKINSIPENTGQIMVMLTPQNMPQTDNPFAEPNVIIQVAEPSDNEVLIDTTGVENGVYNLGITAEKPEALKGEGESPWLAVVQTQVIVGN